MVLGYEGRPFYLKITSTTWTMIHMSGVLHSLKDSNPLILKLKFKSGITNSLNIYNSKNRHITIGTNKEKKVSLYIYQMSNQDPLEEFLNEFKEGHISANLSSKQILSVLKILRKNRPAFSIGEETLGKIRGHNIELYLDV
ncbi:hypothetical protein O181_081994 [Austropuccinia psidii MF-1]|uniref:Uncharacterized protein n=1 Tax=Austropuccinia psidii MF-1 TaxID=1389203 RepID=A0A9Q3FND9_9BASI|nr:hypothetical protein [Austropuccinia psidii MF-1]